MDIDQQIQQASSDEELDVLKTKYPAKIREIFARRMELHPREAEQEQINEYIKANNKPLNPQEFMQNIRDEKKAFKAVANLPEETTTDVPNALFDFFFPGFDEWELKITLYIARHTLGYLKQGDFIAIKEILDGIPGTDYGAGLPWKDMKLERKAAEMRVSRKIKVLERAGVIIAYRGLKAKENDRHPTNYYKLNVKKLNTFKFNVTD